MIKITYAELHKLSLACNQQLEILQAHTRLELSERQFGGVITFDIQQVTRTSSGKEMMDKKHLLYDMKGFTVSMFLTGFLSALLFITNGNEFIITNNISPKP